MDKQGFLWVLLSSKSFIFFFILGKKKCFPSRFLRDTWSNMLSGYTACLQEDWTPANRKSVGQSNPYYQHASSLFYFFCLAGVLRGWTSFFALLAKVRIFCQLIFITSAVFLQSPFFDTSLLKSGLYSHSYLELPFPSLALEPNFYTCWNGCCLEMTFGH